MASKELLSDVLQEYLAETDTGPTRLANLSKVPRKTINHWLSGHALHPRQWQDLIRVAQALHLTEAQADRLLQSAGHKRVRQLLAHAQGSDRALLATFNGHVAPDSTAPFQAPMDLATFVGREAELSQLRTALLDHGHVAIVGVRGMGGVGKSALAAHAAYQLKEDFPDGVLWARLDVTDTLTVLASFADAFGKDVSQFRDVESRAAAVRGLLANKRALLVLDNAGDSTQVKPLLPPSDSRCAVLVTTRNDLDSTDGWPHLPLEGFAAEGDESLQLFAKLLGPKRAARHAQALAQLAGLLGHLPLAVAIVGGQLSFALRHAPQSGERALIQAILTDMRRENARLSRLERDSSSVRASFNLSYDKLPPALQEQFAALGVFGGADFGVDAVTHVWDAPPAAAQTALRALVARSLVQPSRDGRYRLHPLLRDFARERLANRAEAEQNSFMQCITFFEAYVQRHEHDHAALDLEIDNILYTLHAARERRFDRQYLATVHALEWHLETRGLYEQGKAIYLWAIELAEVVGSDEELAHSLADLAALVVRQSDYARTITLCERALKAAEHAGDKQQQVRVLNSLSAASLGRGNFQDMERYNRQGLALACEIGDRRLISNMLVSLGTALAVLGRTEEGEAMQMEGRRIALEVGNYATAVVVSINLGEFYRDQHLFQRARVMFEEGLSLARMLGHRERIANLLINMGELHSTLGSYEQAEAMLKEAAVIADDLQIPWMQSLVGTAYGLHLLRLKNIEKAEVYVSASLDLAQKTQSAELIADNIFAKSRIRMAQHNRQEALLLAGQSLTMFDDQRHMGKANNVRRWITEIQAKD